MTPYALELIRRHDARVAAGKKNLDSLLLLKDKLVSTEAHLKEVERRFRTEEKKAGLLPALVPNVKPKKAPEPATPDIIAFNENLLKL